jgi:hypothetical protein
MAAKPTGGKRGRPRVYDDTRLCIEMARRILRGLARGPWAAAEQVAKEHSDGLHRAPKSVARRLYGRYMPNEQWCLEQAKVRPATVPTQRPHHRGTLATFLESITISERLAAEQQKAAEEWERHVRAFEERNREWQRLTERFARGPFS